MRDASATKLSPAIDCRGRGPWPAPGGCRHHAPSPQLSAVEHSPPKPCDRGLPCRPRAARRPPACRMPRRPRGCQAGCPAGCRATVLSKCNGAALPRPRAPVPRRQSRRCRGQGRAGERSPPRPAALKSPLCSRACWPARCLVPFRLKAQCRASASKSTYAVPVASSSSGTSSVLRVKPRTDGSAAIPPSKRATQCKSARSERAPGNRYDDQPSRKRHGGKTQLGRRADLADRRPQIVPRRAGTADASVHSKGPAGTRGSGGDRIPASVTGS